MEKQVPPVTSKSRNRPVVNEPIIADRTPDPTMYDLIEVYIQDPAIAPDNSSLAYARPYEFDSNKAIKYSATSPHCGCGLDFGPGDMIFRYGRRFLRCQCTPKPEPTVIDDPFVNPIDSGIIDLNDSAISVTVPAALEMSNNLPKKNEQDIDYDVDSIVNEILGR